jgi:hypothetical protein
MRFWECFNSIDIFQASPQLKCLWWQKTLQLLKMITESHMLYVCKFTQKVTRHDWKNWQAVSLQDNLLSLACNYMYHAAVCQLQLPKKVLQFILFHSGCVYAIGSQIPLLWDSFSMCGTIMTAWMNKQNIRDPSIRLYNLVLSGLTVIAEVKIFCVNFILDENVAKSFLFKWFQTFLLLLKWPQNSTKYF